MSYTPNVRSGIDYGYIDYILHKRLTEDQQKATIYGQTPTGQLVPVQVNDEGRLQIDATVSADTSSILVYGKDYQNNVIRPIAVDENAQVLTSDGATHTRLDTIISRLDVNLSTRASEATLSTVASRLYDSTEDKSITDIVKEIRDKPGWDNLLNIDVQLSTRASEQTLSTVAARLYNATEGKSITDIVTEIRDKQGWNNLLNIDITLSSLRDAIIGTGSKSLTDLYNELAQFHFDTDGDLYTARRVDTPTPTSYTTTDTWAVAASYDISKYLHVTILIGNTGSNPADIYVTTMANPNGQLEYPELGTQSNPITLAPGDVVKVQLEGKHALVKIYAKNTVSGNSTTIQVEVIASK